MIDKARAAKAGTLGAYYRFPCPIDSVCLHRLGVTAAQFTAAVAAAPSDEAIIATLRLWGAAEPDTAAFDPIALNEELHGHGS